jgi:DNA repair protein RecO (recombination protein O)
MALVSDRCICLRKVEYSETSQVLTLLGRDRGLLRVIAKGAHRKTKAGASRFGGGLDLLDLGQAVFTDRVDRELATLTEWTLLDGHPALRRNLRALYLGFYAAELVGLLLEQHDPHPYVFELLERLLDELGGPGAEEAFLRFELELLREAGYLPQLDACASCGARLDGRQAYFAPSRGGVVCGNCEPSFPDRLSLDRRLLDLMHYVVRLADEGGEPARRPKLTRQQTDPINRVLAVHLQHTLGQRLRLVDYVV